MRGDHIRVLRKYHIIPLYYHHGIEVSNNEVIHYGEGSLLGKKESKIIRSSMKDFLKNGKKEVVEEKDKGTPDEIVERAKSLLGDQKYNIVFNNCEHFAHWASTGQKTSDQVKKVSVGAGIATGLVGLGTALLLKKRLKEDVVERITSLLKETK